MAETVWHNARELKPSEGELVNVITEGGDHRQLVWKSNLWFLPDLSMYVYFEVSSWSAIDRSVPSLESVKLRADRALRSYRQWADDPRGGTTSNEDLMASVIEDFLKIADSLDPSVSRS